MDTLANKMKEINLAIQELTERKKGLGKDKDRLDRFRRLLWTKGEAILQEAVKDAFEELGFTDIRQERAKDLEDWISDFRSKPLIGVTEVTGADKRTSLKDLRKCADWVTDYDAMGRDCRGILYPISIVEKDIRSPRALRRMRSALLQDTTSASYLRNALILEGLSTIRFGSWICLEDVQDRSIATFLLS